MKKMLKRLCTGFLALATVVTALPTTPVHAESKQYWTESAERVGIIEKVMNDGSIGSTFNEGYMKVEGETAYCIDINTDFKNGYKTRADASSRMSADQISDVALSLEYVKQYGEAHKELNYKQGVYFVTQSSGDVSKESLKNNIGLKFAFRSTDINEIKQTLEFFGIDKDDENNQKRLRDLENGQCLLQDLYGRVGVVQIHPVFEELLHAFDTRPPVQRNEVE